MVLKLATPTPTTPTRRCSLIFLLSVLFLVSLLYSLSFRFTSQSPDQAPPLVRTAPCNYSEGKWVRDRRAIKPRYDQSCKEIYKGWNCIANAKSNGQDLLRWRWQPSGCDLPLADPISFLERYRNTNIGFVGDSLNRNMYLSLVCMLRRESSEVRKWRPAGADRGLTFMRYNLTVAYHRTFLLVHYGSWSATSNGGALESLGYKQGYRIDVDMPDPKWTEAPKFHHILVLNTGHWWWAPSKFDPIQSPMLFFQNGTPVIPPLTPPLGMELALKHMLMYIENLVGPEKLLFFRTQSPRHFEGGEWNAGGSCRREQPLSIEQVYWILWTPCTSNTKLKWNSKVVIS
ncbi:protein trichome birefringence-like 13 [Carex littledalei]|uniref:Protein trichome birefringence-like 13 n=1 Tax=Carex littledalei TaxID=544730 RepID=A0A833VUX4_9POAL|nr:protein trichome birefringence-like 13 [Carex littledalei]